MCRVVHSFIRSIRSTASVERARKTAMMMARPTAASAAATIMTKKTKIWPLHLVPLIGKGDEGEIDGVEHELNGHEDGDEVALDEKADDAERKEHGAEKQIPGERNVVLKEAHFSAVLSVLAILEPSAWASATAPRMAMRMRTEVTSKGSSSSWKSTWLRSSRFDWPGAFESPSPRCATPRPCDVKKDGGEDGKEGDDGREADARRRRGCRGCALRGRR